MSIFFGPVLFYTLLPALTLGVRPFLAVLVLAGGPLLLIWLDFLVISPSPSHQQNAGHMIVLLIMGFVTTGFATMAVARAIGLWCEARGSSRWTARLPDVAAFTVLVAGSFCLDVLS